MGWNDIFLIWDGYPILIAMPQKENKRSCLSIKLLIINKMCNGSDSLRTREWFVLLFISNAICQDAFCELTGDSPTKNTAPETLWNYGRLLYKECMAGVRRGKAYKMWQIAFCFRIRQHKSKAFYSTFQCCILKYFQKTCKIKS